LWHQAWLGQAREEWLGYKTLFHGPIITVLVIAFAFTLLTATASYYLIERPVLRFKDRPPWRRRETVAAARSS
jgi:peptidoglycan/LPS O-acetylase OafA/YrhL